MKDIQEGHPQDAALLLRAQLRLWPRSVELWNLLGIADGELQQMTAAQEAFERGLALEPRSVSLNENIGLLFFKRADYVRAKARLARAIELGSQSSGVRFSLAAARLRTGESDQALSDLTALEPALADTTQYWEERGRAELIRSPARAETSFNRALELAPKSLTALNGAALAAEKQGLEEKALAYLIKARTIAPEDVPTLEHFGAVCIRRDLGIDARDALQKAHRLAPSDNSALYLLARANISIENWQQAYEGFEELSKRLPRFAPAFYAMGWIDIRLNRQNDAKKQLEHCLVLAPDMAGPSYELAQLELDNGRLDVAEKLLRSALKKDPGDAKANAALGDILARKGDLDGAESCFENAIHEDPKLAAAHYKLATLLSRKHETDRAQTERTIAANLNAEANQASKTQLRLVLPEMNR